MIGVLYLITELDVGGAQTALLRLLTHIDRARFCPYVVCFYNGDKLVAQRIRALGIPVTDLGMTGQWRLDALWRLYRLLRRERPVILHTWMFHANLAGRVIGRLANIPVVITSRRNVFIGSPVREWLKRWTAALDDAVIAVCELARQAEINRAGALPDKVMTIYNGIDAEWFAAPSPAEKAAIRHALHLPTHAPLVGTVGRLHPQKGLGDLLKAFAMLRAVVPDVHLLIAGDGELRRDLAGRVEQLGIDGAVTFAGQRDDIPQLLSVLDVFVLASLWEGLPNVVLEAMAAGLPVVATAVGGTPELVVDGVTGLLVPPGDARALAEALESLLRDPECAHRLGRAGCERVTEHFSVEQMTRRTEALYDKLLFRKGLA